MLCILLLRGDFGPSLLTGRGHPGCEFRGSPGHPKTAFGAVAFPLSAADSRALGAFEGPEGDGQGAQGPSPVSTEALTKDVPSLPSPWSPAAWKGVLT